MRPRTYVDLSRPVGVSCCTVQFRHFGLVDINSRIFFGFSFYYLFKKNLYFTLHRIFSIFFVIFFIYNNIKGTFSVVKILFSVVYQFLTNSTI